MVWRLVKKEFRMLRPAFGAALAIAVVLYGGVVGYFCYSARTSAEPEPIWRYLNGAATSALMLTTLLAAAFAVTIATERRERWSDFAAMLPVPRGRVLLARLLTGAGVFAMLWGAHGIVLMATALWSDQSQRLAFDEMNGLQPGRWNLADLNSAQHYTIRLLIHSAAAALSLFGLAWLLASNARSPALAAGAAIGALLLGFVVTMQYPTYYHLYEAPFIDGYFRAAAAVGVVSLVAGTGYSLRRVAP